VTATTARTPSAATLAALKAAIEKETGKTARLHARVDPALLGGVTLRLGSNLLDYSVAGRLHRLERSLHQHIVNA
jgi:F-type H+-transporting ATPase subunit delta